MTWQAENPAAGAAAFAAMGAAVAPNAMPVVYNFKPATTRKLRAALAAYRAGTARMKLLALGDSTTAGYGANGSTDTNARIKSYPELMAALLTARGLASRVDNFFCQANLSASYDPRVVKGAGWVNTSSKSLGGYLLNNSTTTNPLTFTPVGQYTSVDIYHYAGGGVFTVTLGAGTPVDVTPPGGGSIIKTTVTVAQAGLAKGAWAIALAPKVSGNQPLLCGIECYDPAVPDISVLNAGASSFATGDMIGGAFTANNVIGVVAPQVTIINLGINDAQVPVSDATFTSNMQTLITAAKASGDVIICMFTPCITSTVPALVAAGYRADLYALAITNGCVFVDMTERFIDYPTANTDGFMFNTIHPNGLGYADMAQLLSKVIVGV